MLSQLFPLTSVEETKNAAFFFTTNPSSSTFYKSLFFFPLKLNEKKTRLRLASEREIGSRRSEFQAKRSILFLCLRVRKNRVRGDFFLLVEEAPPFEVQIFSTVGKKKQNRNRNICRTNEEPIDPKRGTREERKGFLRGWKEGKGSKTQRLKSSKAQKLKGSKEGKSSKAQEPRSVCIEREGVDPKRVKSSRIRSRREAPGIGRRDGNRPHLVTSFTRNSVLSIVKLSPTTGRPRFAPRSWPFLSRAKSS